MDILEEARRVFDIEIGALQNMRDSLDDSFKDILLAITNCRGKVIITGMGKPGHIAAKMAATLSSLGTPAFNLHPGEAMHGDMGMIEEDDIIIAISYSGESEELIGIVPFIKMIGSKLIVITGNKESSLAEAADILQILPKFNEACYLGLAPTSSTTVELCYGDALAVVASGIYGFREVDFGKLHPAGSLGKRLLYKVSDLMNTGENVPIISEDALLIDAIEVISEKKMGIVNILNTSGHLSGIMTDYDLRKVLRRRGDIYSIAVKDVMNCDPKVFHANQMAADALRFMRENNVTVLPIVDADRKVIGTIHIQQIIKAGIMV